MPQVDFIARLRRTGSTITHKVRVPFEIGDGKIDDIIPRIPELFGTAIELAADRISAALFSEGAKRDTYKADIIDTLHGEFLWKPGATRDFLVEAVDHDGDIFREHLAAVDEVDAELRARFYMAQFRARDAGQQKLIQTDLATFVEWMQVPKVARTVLSTKPVEPHELEQAFVNFYQAVASGENIKEADETARAILVRAGLIDAGFQPQDELITAGPGY